MFRPRLIPVLLLHNQALVKSTNFGDFRYIGDPVNTVRLFNDFQADELILLDITASKEGRLISLDLVREITSEADMPVAVGGGISELGQIQALVACGAEKVVIGSQAVAKPTFIESASQQFGSSTISVCIDTKSSLDGQAKVWSACGTAPTEHDPVVFAKEMESRGAGEIIIQSIDRDGTMKGYDLDILATLSANLRIPVVALGGAGSREHFQAACASAALSGLAAGSFFVLYGPRKGVLVTYPDRSELSSWLSPSNQPFEGSLQQ